MTMANYHVPLDGNNLTLPELECLAEEIYSLLTNNEGLTLDDYIKKTKTISIKELGYRKSRAILNEPLLQSFFPDEVYKVLYDKLSKIPANNICVNEDDKNFLKQNAHRGYKWLSKNMFSNINSIQKVCYRSNINVETNQHRYTQPEILLIKNNLHMGLEWLSTQIKTNKKSIKNKIRCMGLTLPNTIIPRPYTKEEDEIIKNNLNKGTRWIATQLKNI